MATTTTILADCWIATVAKTAIATALATHERQLERRRPESWDRRHFHRDLVARVVRRHDRYARLDHGGAAPLGGTAAATATAAVACDAGIAFQERIRSLELLLLLLILLLSLLLVLLSLLLLRLLVLLRVLLSLLLLLSLELLQSGLWFLLFIQVRIES